MASSPVPTVTGEGAGGNATAAAVAAAGSISRGRKIMPLKAENSAAAACDK